MGPRTRDIVIRILKGLEGLQLRQSIEAFLRARHKAILKRICLISVAVFFLLVTLTSTSSIAQNGSVKSFQKIADNTGGFNVTLTDSDTFSKVAAVGDLDNDGVEDLVVGANNDDTGGPGRGAVYVLFMNTDGTVKSWQKIADNTGGFNVTLTNSDFFGTSVAGVGDLDNDGVEDLVVGANTDDTGGSARGAVYVLFLNTDGTVQELAEDRRQHRRLQRHPDA